MKSFNNKFIIGIDHGYGNIKTANHCFKTGIIASDTEPIFTKNMLVYDGKYFLIGEGHKEFRANKDKDDEYYLLTLAAIAMELKDNNLYEADVIIAAGLPLTWTGTQKAQFAAYLKQNKSVAFTYNGIDYNVDISGVMIYPQGYAAIAQIKLLLQKDGSYVINGYDLIPCCLSSTAGSNDFRPVPYEADTAEYTRTISKLNGSFSGPDLNVDYSFLN